MSIVVTRPGLGSSIELLVIVTIKAETSSSIGRA